MPPGPVSCCVCVCVVCLLDFDYYIKVILCLWNESKIKKSKTPYGARAITQLYGICLASTDSGVPYAPPARSDF